MIDCATKKPLVEHLFDQDNIAIPGISYAVGYELADGATRGDVVDVYHYDNNCIAFAIADVSGTGSRAKVNAALITFSVRAFGLFEEITPKRVARALDWLYLENNALAKTQSFASVFFAVVDPTHRLMTYTNAGHEPVLLIAPDGSSKVLAPTAPLVGVFDDQHGRFKHAFAAIVPGTLFIGATDGVTQARGKTGDVFGMERFTSAAVANRGMTEPKIVQSIVDATLGFSTGTRRDDIAVAAIRFL
jgi:sigma-B regulation protein RsbU (phosphoserine phosphatase)